jgi:hypothetical protein
MNNSDDDKLKYIKTLTFAECLALAGQKMPISLSIAASPLQPPRPDAAIDEATQIKLQMIRALLSAIGTFPGDVKIDQTINYRKLSQTSQDFLRKLRIRPQSKFSSFAVDYLGLFDEGKVLPKSDSKKANLFYNRLIHLLAVEAQLLLAWQYYEGLGFAERNIPLSLWQSILSPSEFQGIRLANTNNVELIELHGRMFLEYFVILVRAQWDKLIRLTCFVFDLADNWSTLSKGLTLLTNKIKDKNDPLPKMCRIHVEVIVKIAEAQTTDGKWLKEFRDNLLHKVGRHSAGVLAQEHSILTTQELWNKARDEHQWLREAMMAALIAFRTADSDYSLS